VDNRSEETTERPTLDAPPIAEAIRDLRVERVERADGSYALYFTWSSAPSAEGPVMGPEEADV